MKPLRIPLLLASLGLLAVLCPAFAHAADTMALKGTVFSSMHDEYVIRSGDALVHLRKNLLPHELRERFDKASAHEISTDVPMEAIVRIRRSGPQGPGPGGQ